MAESAAYARRSFSGLAVPTTLGTAINNSATTFSGADLSTWTATDDNGPGRAQITDGTNVERFEFTGVSGNTFTGVTRGIAGTTARAWNGGEALTHVSTDRDFDEANLLVHALLGLGLSAGDIVYALTANTFQRLAIGTARQNLQVNSAGTGLAYNPSLQSLIAAAGDIVYGSAANTAAKLAAGTAYQSLNMNAGATAPAWQASLQSLITAAGDLIYGSGANTPAKLAAGSALQALAMNAGATAPSWVASLQSLMTGTGDLVVSSGANTPARLAIGTARQALAANSGATGLTYVASLQSLLSAKGSIVGASGANTPVELTVGTNTQVLTADSTQASGMKWATPAAGATSVKSARHKRTAGDITTNSTAWAALSTATDLTLTGVLAGDVIEVSPAVMVDNVGAVDLFFDVTTIVSAAVVNYVSGGALFGVAGWYCPQGSIQKLGGPVQYVVQSGDLSAGSLTLRLYYKGGAAANRIVYADTNYVLMWSAKNLGQ